MNPPRTPREVLLTRHAESARPALDAQREALLARFVAAEPACVPAARSPRANLRELISVLHRELFAPYRRAWCALACAWVAILAFQQLDRLAGPNFFPPRVSETNSAADAALLALWLEQRRQLAALAADPGFRAPPAPARETISPPAASGPLGFAEPVPTRLATA